MSGNKEKGFSLLEVMIAMSIISVISYLAVGSCNRQNRATTQLSARSQTQAEMDQLLALVRRDHKFQITNGSHVLPTGLGYQVDRVSPGQGDPNVTYQVTFASICLSSADVDANFAAAYDEDFSKKVNEPGNPPDHPCLSKLKCGKGEYPAVQITTTGIGAPQYVPARFPTIGKSLVSTAFGMAICVEEQGTRLNVSTEGIATSGEAGTYIPFFVKRSLSLPKTGTAGLVLMPN